MSELDWSYTLTVQNLHGIVRRPGVQWPEWHESAAGATRVVAPLGYSVLSPAEVGDAADRITALINSQPRSPTRDELIAAIRGDGAKTA